MSSHVDTETLSAYLDGEVSERERQRLERHLAECAECRRRLEGLREVVGGLGSLERVRPPRRVGLELQSRLVQAVPPFERDARLGGRLPRLLFQPAILASLGVVLALVVIVLLFLHTLERSSAPSSSSPGVTPTVESGQVIIGERRFRPVPEGWVEVGLGPAEIESAVSVHRPDLESERMEDAELGVTLEELAGEITLRLRDGRVVRVMP